jgi:hypothetical protein
VLGKTVTVTSTITKTAINAAKATPSSLGAFRRGAVEVVTVHPCRAVYLVGLALF